MIQLIRWTITTAPVWLAMWGGYKIYNAWQPLYTQRVVWGAIALFVLLIGVYTLRKWAEYKRTSAVWHHRTGQGKKLVTPHSAIRQIGPPPQTVRGGLVAPTRPPNQESIFLDLPAERYELDVEYE